MSEGCYCEIYEGEDPDFIVGTAPRARKEHKCCECLEPIHPGEVYERVFGVWDGEAQTFRTCAHCAELRDEVRAATLDTAPPFGDLACWYMAYMIRPEG